MSESVPDKNANRPLMTSATMDNQTSTKTVEKQITGESVMAKETNTPNINKAVDSPAKLVVRSNVLTSGVTPKKADLTIAITKGSPVKLRPSTPTTPRPPTPKAIVTRPATPRPPTPKTPTTPKPQYVPAKKPSEVPPVVKKATASTSVPDIRAKEKLLEKRMTADKTTSPISALENQVSGNARAEAEDIVKKLSSAITPQIEILGEMIQQLKRVQEEANQTHQEIVQKFYPAKIEDGSVVMHGKADAQTEPDIHAIKQDWPSINSIKRMCTWSEQAVLAGLKHLAVMSAISCIRSAKLMLILRPHCELFTPLKALESEMDKAIINSEAIRVLLNDKIGELNYSSNADTDDPLINIEESQITDLLTEIMESCDLHKFQDETPEFQAEAKRASSFANIASSENNWCESQREDESSQHEDREQLTADNRKREEDRGKSEKFDETSANKTVAEDSTSIGAEDADNKGSDSPREEFCEMEYDSTNSNSSVMSRASITPEVHKHMDSPKRQKKLTSYVKKGESSSGKPVAVRQLKYTFAEDAEEEVIKKKKSNKRRIGDIIDEDDEEEEEYPKIKKIKDTSDALRRIMWYGEKSIKDIKSDRVKDYISGLMSSSVFQYGKPGEPEGKKCRKKCCVLCPYTVPENDRNDARHYKNNHSSDDQPSVRFVKVNLTIKEFAARCAAWYPIMMRNQNHK